MTTDDSNCTGPILDVFNTELKNKYGDDVSIKLKTDIVTKDLTPVKIT